MKTSSFFRIFRSAALVLGFVFGLFFAGQARANYIDGANLYGGYFAERVGMDPDGMWTIDRHSSHAWAKAIPEEGDTLQTLSLKVNLDQGEVDKWLKVANAPGHGNPQGPMPCDISTSHLATINDGMDIQSCRCYWVPNTVVVTVGDSHRLYIGSVGIGHTEKFKTEADDYASTFSSSGYKSVFSGGVDIADTEAALKTDGICGWMFSGHGDEYGGLMLKTKGVGITEGNAKRALPYKLGRILLYACGGAKGPWGLVVSENGGWWAREDSFMYNYTTWRQMTSQGPGN